MVSNTSPLLNLAILDALDLLVQQFRTLLLPEAVFAELQIDTSLPGAAALRSAYQDGLFRVEPVTDRVRVRLLQRDLDAGEAEAIGLALEKSADWLLLDERDGRRGRSARQARALEPVDGPTSVVLSDPPEHARRRALVRSGLHRAQVQSYVATMARTASGGRWSMRCSSASNSCSSRSMAGRAASI